MDKNVGKMCFSKKRKISILVVCSHVAKIQILHQLFMCLQDMERRNTELEDRVQSTEKTLASNREDQVHAEVEVRRIIDVLDIKIGDLNNLRESLAKLINK